MNVGVLDRWVRFVFGLVLVMAAFVSPFAELVAGWGAWKYALTICGVVMLATALFRFCPAYTLLGIRTCERAQP
ncbi:YgaP family membrane protein [Bosea sp. (in: a-proteobacteria)]|uniref:YgaP family membrane protein n=1 Tax=Bosea sp. (in: a-proteobacteria) TaxID=1871050 RepID=UPI002FC77E88